MVSAQLSLAQEPRVHGKSLATQQLPQREVGVRSPSCSCPQLLALPRPDPACEWPQMMSARSLPADAKWSTDKLAALSPIHKEVNVFGWLVRQH